MNLLTDNSPGKLLGGWELLKLILDVPTTTTIKSSNQFFSPGQKVTFTATVTSSPVIGVATGTITFIDSGLSQTILATVSLSGGKASFTTTLPNVTQYVKAVYSGDKYYKGSESGYITAPDQSHANDVVTGIPGVPSERFLPPAFLMPWGITSPSAPSAALSM